MENQDFNTYLQPDFLTPDVVAAATGKSTEEVLDLIEQGKLDFRFRTLGNVPVAHVSHIQDHLHISNVNPEN